MINYDIKARVAATQFEPVWYNAHETITKMISYIEEAAANGAKLVSFGECAIPGYMYHVWTDLLFVNHAKYDIELTNNSLEIDGPEMRRIMRAARDNNIYVETGYIERDGASRYMSQVIISDEGKILLNRRKLKPTDGERCVCGDGTGADLKVVETPIGILGTTECWEHAQPLITYAMTSMHEQIHIAAWPGNSFKADTHLMRGNENILDFSRVYAMQAQTYVVLATLLTGDACIDYFDGSNVLNKGGGHAQIISPDGDFLCEPLPADQEGIVYADIDLNHILAVKAMIDPVGQYSRPDIFCLNINKDPKPFTKVINETVDTKLIDQINSEFCEED